MDSQVSLPLSCPDFVDGYIHTQLNAYSADELAPWCWSGPLTPTPTRNREQGSASSGDPFGATPVARPQQQAATLSAPPLLRKRLREKTSVHERGSSWCAQASPDSSRLETTPEVPGDDALHSTPQSHRQIYKRFHQHFGRWLCRRRREPSHQQDESADTWESFLAADSLQRQVLLNEWELQTTPERALRDWAASYWVTQRASDSKPTKGVDKHYHDNWFRGQSLLVTWNGDWGCFKEPPGVGDILHSIGAPFGELAKSRLGDHKVIAAIELIVQELQQTAVGELLWKRAQEHVLMIAKKVCVRRSCSVLGTLRLHIACNGISACAHPRLVPRLPSQARRQGSVHCIQ